MRTIIENEYLKVTVESHGAELKSVQDKVTGMEYMWTGDPAFWGRTSPVLFPFVGDVRDGHYFFEGTEYKMSSHGFARDSEFVLSEQTTDTLWYKLTDTDKTYANYPFHFILEVGYVLCERSVSLKWRVTNPGQDREDQHLYFSIGGHPAFSCPVGDDTAKAGYQLYFAGADEIHHHGNLTGTATHEDLVLPLTNHRAVITPEFFDRSTYIVEGKQTGCVAIETPDGKPYVTVDFDTPLFGVWSPLGKNAPFLCIEPWWGRTDYDDFAGELPEREYGNTLGKDEVFENTYTVTFGNLS